MTTTPTTKQPETTGEADRGRLAGVGDKVRETTEAARTRASEAYSAARERTSAAYGSVRERATNAVDAVRDTASTATRKTSEGIDANPAAAVVGGLALGALAAVLLPVTRRESEVLGDVGRRLGDKAREAARTAREAGTSKLEQFGLDTVKEKLSEIGGSKSGD